MRRICIALCLVGLIAGMTACGRTERATGGEPDESYGKEQESTREDRQKNEIAGRSDKDNGEVRFECGNIEAAVREQMDHGSTAVIRQQTLEEIEELSISFENEDEPACIADDLRYFTNLRVLNIFVDTECREEKVLDYEELGTGGTLNKLEELFIRDCYLEDISFVKKLDSLKQFFIPEANVRDISVLREMKQLTHLSLYDTPIQDAEPIGELTNLVELSLANCGKAKNIEAIASLTKMENLGLMYCGIEDISFLKDMKNLHYLNLAGNKVEDISLLTQFTQLNALSLDDNEITDVSALIGMKNLAVVSVNDNPVKNLGLLVGVVPSFDVSAAESTRIDEWNDEVEKALQIYDVTTIEIEGHLLEIEDYYVGDATGDGIDDVGIVASYIIEDLYNTKKYRMLYVYPGTGSSYRNPLEPKEIRDEANGGEGGYPYNGIILQDGKLIIQYEGGSNYLWRITRIYKLENQTWDLVMRTELDWYIDSTGYEYWVTNYENRIESSYILCIDELHQWHKLKINEGTITSENTEKEMPHAWNTYCMYLYHYEVEELPCSAQKALEMVADKFEYEKEKVYITNVEGLDSCEKLFGFELPDYYYTMDIPDGFVEICYYDKITGKNSGELEKHGIRIYVDGKPYKLYTVEVQSGKMKIEDYVWIFYD